MMEKKKATRALISNNFERIAKSKRSQITPWIIVAIVLVALIALLFYFTPLKNLIIPTTPSIRLQDCVSKDLDEAVNLISERGGSINPVNGYMYSGNKVEYLCYTNQYYQTCSNQQPLLKQHIEREILEYIEPEAKSCIDNVISDLRNKGWQVSGASGLNVEILPENIKVTISGVNIVKENTGQSWKKFEFAKKSQLYDLIMLTSSILNWEARYGDVDITTYMIYYPNVKVEKLKQSDGSKIFLLTEKTREDKFIFATRSLSWPAGYGFGQTYKPV